MQGLIFSVKRYSIQDGPGIRVTFFLKGCPLSCWWCHNPEGINPATDTFYTTRRMGETELEISEEVGKNYSVDDVLDILRKERIFMEQSNGGVTFSGGEPLMQDEFLLQALIACKHEGYHTAVDTSGYAPAETFRSVIPFTDLFLYDIKHVNDSRHVKYTGVSNRIIIENLSLVLSAGKKVVIRLPVIPGVNDDHAALTGFRNLITGLKRDNIVRISLLPYHDIGRAKYDRLKMAGKMKETAQPDSTRMKEIKEFFEETGIEVSIGS